LEINRVASGIELVALLLSVKAIIVAIIITANAIPVMYKVRFIFSLSIKPPPAPPPEGDKRKLSAL